MEKIEIDLLVIEKVLEKRRQENESERPFLQLDIEDYPVVQKEVKPKDEPRRVIIIDL